MRPTLNIEELERLRGINARLDDRERYLEALEDAAPALIAAARRDAERRFECAGRKQSLPEPGECNWPFCDCDPYADKVFAAVQECDKELIDRSEIANLREALKAAEEFVREVWTERTAEVKKTWDCLAAIHKAL